jgi:hypothetical protein
MKLSVQDLKDLVLSEVDTNVHDADYPEDVEALEGVWSGGDNLVNSVDHGEVASGHKTIAEPETLKITEKRNSLKMDKKDLLKIIREELVKAAKASPKEWGVSGKLANTAGKGKSLPYGSGFETYKPGKKTGMYGDGGWEKMKGSADIVSEDAKWGAKSVANLAGSGKSLPYGSGYEKHSGKTKKTGMYGDGGWEQVKGAPDLVSHSCATHAKLKSISEQKYFGINDKDAVGKCVWHSLTEGGDIGHYDVEFGSQLIENIPSAKLEILHEARHAHEARDSKAKKKDS